MENKKDRYVFPAIFEYRDSVVGVSFPDLPGAITQGDDDAEALRMAKECLSLHLYGLEEEGDDIPAPTPVNKVELESSDEAIVLIDVWMPPFRDEMEEKAVKKTVTLPKWLRDLGEEENVNFSRLLQDALKSYLGVKDHKRDAN